MDYSYRPAAWDRARVRTEARSGARPGWWRPMPFGSLTAIIDRYAVVKTTTN